MRRDLNRIASLTDKRGDAERPGAGQRRTSRIYLLGQMQVSGPNGENLLPAAKKTRAVLAYLCLSDGQVLPRTTVAEMIWCNSGPAQGLEALRHAIAQIGKIDGGWRIERGRQTVRFDASGCWLDVLVVPDVAERLLRDLYGTISTAFDHWLLAERVNYETRWQSSLERKLSDLVDRKAAADERARAARELFAVQPIHSGAINALMMAFADMDEPAEAIREFERYKARADKAEVPISRRTMALYEAIRRGPKVKILYPLSGAPADPSAGPPAQPAAQASREAPSQKPERGGLLEPSIAVLPLRSLVPVRGSDHIAQGLTEDLVEALSRVPAVFVVSRLSAGVFRKQDRLPQEIGAALGVRYLLSGTVRIIENRVRLNIELAEADTGRGLWRDRFDANVLDLLNLQSELADMVVRAVAPELRSAERRRLRLKRPEHYTAYDYFLKAQENMHSEAREVFESAEGLFRAAIDLEPDYGTAFAWLAYWHVMRVGQGWSPDAAVDAQQAERLAARAIECDPREAMAYAVEGHAAAYLRRDFDRAFESFRTALEINHNSARAWLWSANAHGWTGDGARAVENVNRAMALSPYDPLICAYSGSASLAYLAAGQFERAIEFALRSIRENRAYSAAYKILVPALVLAGHAAEARGRANQLLRLEPRLTVAKFKHRFPGAAREIGRACAEALASAGIPISD
jgi:TolB-like protein/DNA-binding SARP family transcriptional activator/Tfp pilus assembly protein PilF